MNTGISLYFSSGFEANAALVARAADAGARFAFTSLHIPEETCDDYAREARRMIALCRDAGLSLIADVSPVTLQKLGVSRLEDLLDLGIEYVRLDFGFDAARTVELSRTFHVVFNASTLSERDVAAWRAAGADLSRFCACHNFYPKPLTGLDIADVARTNARLKALGFTVMSFVPGDAELRGPLCEGLPTVEAHRGHRGEELALDALELFAADSDVVMLGDPGASDVLWERLGQISRDCIDLACELEAGFEWLYGRVQHDRPDSSPWLVRSQEARLWDDAPEPPAEPVADPEAAPDPAMVRPGDVVMSTQAYGRYAGELSIARAPFPLDPRDAVVGSVANKDLALLGHVRRGMGFRLVRA